MDLLFVGDSLIEFHSWQAAFPAHRVENRGRAGETVAELLARARRLTARRPAPDWLLLMSGTNDLIREEYDFLPAYEVLLDHLRSAFPSTRIAVNSLLPIRLPWLAPSAVPRMNRELAALAARKEALSIDAYARFLDSGAPLESLLLEDGVHLREAGYRLWAEAIAGHLGL